MEPPERPFRPPRSRWKQLWGSIYRNSFAIACFVVIVALGALLLFSPERAKEEIDLTGLTRSHSAPDTTAKYTYYRSVSKVTMSVFSYPRGATVFVDGDSVGTTPLGAYSLKEGSYSLTIQKEKYVPVDTVASLKDSKKSIFSFPLKLKSNHPENPSTPPRSGDNRAEGNEQRAPRPPPSSSEKEDEPPADSKPEVGTLQLTSEPSGALALIDGEAVGQTPRAVKLASGSHELVFRHSGYVAYSTKVTVRPPLKDTVHAQLQELGRLAVLAKPWGSIYVDDELHAGESDVRYTTTLPAGTHDLRVEHPSLGTWHKTVTIKSGSTRSVTVNMNEEGGKVGRLKVSVEPWGTIYIDGELREREADMRYTTTLPAGTHDLRVEHPSLGTWHKTIEMQSGDARSIVVNMNLEHPNPKNAHQ